MRILVISDVHGNIIALNKVLKTPHDVVIFAGDMVDYGPSPKECVDTIRKTALFSVRGNHDNAAGLGVDCHCSQKMHELSVETRKFTRRVLNKDDLDYLASLPLSAEFMIDGKHFFMVHASFGDPLFKYLDPRKMPLQEIEKEFENVDADFIIFGHTHIPVLIKRASGGYLLNPGSVGQPRDGNPKASFALIDTKTGKAEIIRISYDIEQVAKDIKERGLPLKLIDILHQQY